MTGCPNPAVSGVGLPGRGTIDFRNWVEKVGEKSRKMSTFKGGVRGDG